MRYLFVCGGTAGHINPAIAVADRLRAMYPDSEFLFIGSGRELENRLIPAAGYRIKNIKMTGFSRGLGFLDIKKNINTVKNLSQSTKESKSIIGSFVPDIVIGTGGYVCYPVLKAAVRRGIPTVMHESNAVPGLTTKMLSGSVDRVLVAFEGVADRYKKPKNVIITGTPVREDFVSTSKDSARKQLRIGARKLVVSFWGSLGASYMNDMMADFIKLELENENIRHIHGAGSESAVSAIKEKLSRMGISEIPERIEIRPYINDMGKVMAAADLTLCRAGASTLAEITAVGVPSVLVPSPNVTNDHQTKNARELEKCGAAVLIEEKGCTGKKLFETVTGLLNDKAKLSAMGQAALGAGEKDAALKIVNVIKELIN